MEVGSDDTDEPITIGDVRRTWILLCFFLGVVPLLAFSIRFAATGKLLDVEPMFSGAAAWAVTIGLIVVYGAIAGTIPFELKEVRNTARKSDVLGLWIAFGAFGLHLFEFSMREALQNPTLISVLPVRSSMFVLAGCLLLYGKTREKN